MALAHTARISEDNHCASHQELMIRFALWASGLHEIPSWERIRAHFRVSRATAYRWRRSWCDAIGMDPPKPQRHRKLTHAEIVRVKKQTAGLTKAMRAADACLACEFFKPPHQDGWWGHCRKHAFAVRPGNTCSQQFPRK